MERFTLAFIIVNVLYAIASIFILSSFFYIMLVFASNKMLKRQRLNWPFLNYNHPPVSLIVPAYNEEKDILESVKALFQQNYKEFEIIIVNDGSKDNTLQVLLDAYTFNQVPFDQDRFKLCQSEIKAIYKSDTLPLYIIDKENGKKADALNAGIDFSNYDFVCTIDADSIIEPNAFNRVMQEFALNPTMIACGGSIRVINGSEVSNGLIRKVQMPSGYLEICQLLEYTQTFFMGRIGWQKFNATMIISGAFGVFKKAAILEVNGFDKDSVGEDMDLIVRLHKHFLHHDKEYTIGFVPDPLCWTEVPSSFKTLANQRNRWQRGLLTSIFGKRPYFFNTRKSSFSRLSIPYYILTEVISPVIEVASYILIAIGIAFGIIDWKIVVLFSSISILFSVVISIIVLIHEDKLFTKNISMLQSVNLIFASFAMNIGYRQFLVWQRIKGFIDFLLNRQDWGEMDRSGFIIRKRKKKTNETGINN